MNFKVSQLKSLTAGEVAVDDLIYVIDSNPTDGSVKSKKVTVGDLIDSRIYGISSSQFVLITGYYADPSWISSLDWSKITNAPSFVTSLSALTDVQLSTPLSGQALVYNGTKWVNQGIGELDTLNSVTTRGNTTTNPITVGGLTTSGSITAASAIARGAYFNNTLVAAANNDVLVGLDISTTFTNGAFTGVKNASLRTQGWMWSNSGIVLGSNAGTVWSSGVPINAFQISPGGIYYVGSGSGFSHSFRTNANNSVGERLRITDAFTAVLNGNLLVNSTTDAGYKLDVNGTARVQNTLTVTKGGNNFFTFEPSANGTTPYWDMFFSGQTSIRFDFANNGATRVLRIRDSINLTTPYALDCGAIFSNGNIFTTGNYLWLQSTTDNYIRYTDAGIAHIGVIGTADATTYIQVRTGGAISMTSGTMSTAFFNSGNVGINTTTDAGYKLDVNGTARIQGNTEISRSGSDTQLTIARGGGASLTLQAKANTTSSSEGVNLYWTANTWLKFVLGSSVVANFSNVGNLLVGTSTDSGYKLDVNGSVRVQGELSLTDGNILRQSGAGSGLRFISNNIQLFNQGVNAVGSFILDASGTSIRVGFGTTSPDNSSILDLTSTTRGFLKPRLTTTEKNAITTPATGLEVYDSTTNTPNYFNGTTWVGVASNQSTGLSPGLFSQTSDSIPVVNTTVETTLISTGVGTLSVPANQFQVGASYIAYLSGVISSQNNATMEIHLRSNGFILADTDSMILSATTGKFWELHVNFVIRAIGGGGVAAIVTSGRFSYNKDSGNIPESIGFSDVNNTTFDTTINNTLTVTATWGNASPSNSIQTRIFNLYRVY